MRIDTFQLPKSQIKRTKEMEEHQTTYSVAFLTKADNVPTNALSTKPQTKVYLLPLTSAKTPDSSPLINIPAK